MIPKRPKEKPKSALQKLAEKSSRPASGVSSRPRTQREKEEDEYIAKLEAKLTRGMGDGKQDEDGLDGQFPEVIVVKRSFPIPCPQICYNLSLLSGCLIGWYFPVSFLLGWYSM
jgi:hypothetical protein